MVLLLLSLLLFAAVEVSSTPGSSSGAAPPTILRTPRDARSFSPENLPGVPSTELPSCYKPGYSSHWPVLSGSGKLWQYYHFLVDFAVPAVYYFNREPTGVKKLILSDWYRDSKYKLVPKKDRSRTEAQRHFDFLFKPISLILEYSTSERSLAARIAPCKAVEFVPGNWTTASARDWQARFQWSNLPPHQYQYFREYAHNLAGVESKATALSKAAYAVPSAGRRVLFIRRGDGKGHSTCTGGCRRKLDGSFFPNAEKFMREKNIPFHAVIFDDMPLQEQIRIFANASMVIGMHGAGLSNVLFAQPGVALVELARSGNVQLNPNCFEPLARSLHNPYVHCNDTKFSACVQNAILKKHSVESGVAVGHWEDSQKPLQAPFA